MSNKFALRKHQLLRANKTLNIVLMIVTVFSFGVASGQEITGEELISLISAMEDNTQVLEYHAVFEKLTLDKNIEVDLSKPNATLLNLAKPTGIKKRMHYLTEPGTGRTYYKRQGTSPSITGGSSQVRIREKSREVGFDGNTRTDLVELPGERGQGRILKEPLKINKELSSFEMGMDLLLPCYRGVGLSRYLQSDDVQASSIKGKYQGDGTLEVEFYRKDDQRFRLVIDTQKDGAILSEEYFLKGSDDVVVVKMEYIWKKNDNDKWIPVNGYGVQGSSIMYHWFFDSFQKNHLDPSPDNYRVTFPFGTDVNDEIYGINYTVGQMPRDVAFQVNKTLEETFTMNSSLQDGVGYQTRSERVTETKEIPEVIASADFVEANIKKAEKNGRSHLLNIIYSLVAVIFLLTIFITYVFIKNKSRVLMILLVASVFMTSHKGYAKATSQFSPEVFDGWTAKGPGNDRIPIYQCGHYSTVFLLEYFDLKYENEQLLNLMTPTVNGISLSDIVNILKLHGLNVQSRKEVNAKDLYSHVTKEQIVLLPTDPSGAKGHYYVVVPGKLSDYLLVDPGKKVVNFSKEQMQKMLDRNNGLCVFVTNNGIEKDAQRVKFSDAKFNLGKFSNSGPNQIAEFVLENTSNQDVLIKDVSASCSCMANESLGSIIKSKEKFIAEVAVNPHSWGTGKATKDVLFIFGDHSFKKVTIEGDCFAEESLHNLKLVPTEIFIDRTETENGIISRNIQVFTNEENIFVNSDADWISGKLLKKDNDKYYTIEVVLQIDKLENKETVGYLNIWSKENVSKIKLPIHIASPRQFKIEPRIGNINLKDEKAASVDFNIIPIFKNDQKIKIVDALSHISELDMKWDNTDGGSVKLSASLKRKDATPGLHTIHITISIDGDTYSERVYVLIQ